MKPNTKTYFKTTHFDDGGFINNEALKHHLKKYGKEGIINKLTYMQWCVWNTFMEINREVCNATMQRQDKPNEQEE